MQLDEKLAPLGIGNLRIAGRFAKRPVRVESLEQRLVVVGFANLDDRAAFTSLAKRGFPVVVKQVTAGYLLEVIGDALGDVVRLDQQAKRITDKIVAESPGCVV